MQSHTPPAPPTALPTPWLLLSGLPWLLLLGWLTSVTWFVCDDAFISFRYVRNLVEGHGLVFNPGEYVEGYTNFLWVLELAAIWSLLGIPPEQAAPVLSVICTVGTLAAMLWWVYRLPGVSHRGLVGWMASARRLRLDPLHHARARENPGPLRHSCARRNLAVMGGPFALVVASHYLWRYSYYGEWLPNTYYAKYVAPWYDAGLHYLARAGIETGLYLLVPLALLAGIVRWKRSQDGTYAVVLLLIGVHMTYLARIGGDHFEYRPLDFYWPLLAVAAAEGLLVLGTFVATPGQMREWRRSPQSSSRPVRKSMPLALTRGRNRPMRRVEGGRGGGGLGLSARGCSCSSPPCCSTLVRYRARCCTKARRWLNGDCLCTAS